MGRIANSTQFRFLELPPELRLLIYEMLAADSCRSVGSNENIALPHAIIVGRPILSKTMSTNFAIADVCQLLRAEALPVSFAHCTLSLGLGEDELAVCRAWIEAQDDAGLRGLSLLRFTGWQEWCPDMLCCWDFAEHLTINLREGERPVKVCGESTAATYEECSCVVVRAIVDIIGEVQASERRKISKSCFLGSLHTMEDVWNASFAADPVSWRGGRGSGGWFAP